jgi:hypothetical protein
MTQGGTPIKRRSVGWLGHPDEPSPVAAVFDWVRSIGGESKRPGSHKRPAQVVHARLRVVRTVQANPDHCDHSRHRFDLRSALAFV